MMILNSSTTATADATQSKQGLDMEGLLRALQQIPPAPERKYGGMYLSTDSLKALERLLKAERVTAHPFATMGLAGIEVGISEVVPYGTAVLWKYGKSIAEVLHVPFGDPIDYMATLPKVVGILDFTKELQDDDTE